MSAHFLNRVGPETNNYDPDNLQNCPFLKKGDTNLQKLLVFVSGKEIWPSTSDQNMANTRTLQNEKGYITSRTSEITSEDYGKEICCLFMREMISDQLPFRSSNKSH